MIDREFKYHQTSCYKTITKPDETTLNLLNLPNKITTKMLQLTLEILSPLQSVLKQILMQNQAISMNVLHELYGLHENDTHYRNKLNIRLQSAFPDQLCFLLHRTNQLT